jgi:UDP-N-acetylglucosamine 2-epimerase (non-hydrolysing)
VIGTRPEAIKMAPVVEAFRARGNEVQHRLVHTGQHTSLADQAFASLRLERDDFLGIMREGQNLYDLAHACLSRLRDVVAQFRPHAMLVQGDTASVCFGAFVGYFEHVRVGHVEAGLRSYHPWAPYPEEVFRRVADAVAYWHFAPTPRAAAQLKREGAFGERIHVTGNTVVDALQDAAKRPHKIESEALAEALTTDSRLVLLTAHRRESFGEPLRTAFKAIRALADERPDVTIVYPVHPNPNVKEAAAAVLTDHPRIRLIEPVGYLDLVTALRHAALVITDSGGIQEEAPTFRTPVLVLRDVTERPEGVQAGVARLVGTDPAGILRGARAALDGKWKARARNPYGDGRAGERIADIVLADLTGARRRTRDWVQRSARRRRDPGA